MGQPSPYSIVLFLALCVVSILYVGALRDIETQREWGDRMYRMLTEAQKRQLQDDFEIEHWVKSQGRD